MRAKVISFMLLAVMATTPVYAAESIPQKIGDWFATLGKSDTEKQAILAERKAIRTIEQAEKEVQQKTQVISKEVDKQAAQVGKAVDAVGN